jgi:glycosyltransferase involved in cell wall biosynthesis
VDLDRFQPRDPVSAGPVFRAAFVGRLVDWKAVDMLIDALHRARADRPITLDIFGDGETREALEAQVERLQLHDAVRFHGFVPQDQVSNRLRDFDALVLPSLYECGGAVVLEAMAIGLPVIASRWGGPADYLDDGCGILIVPESRDQMVTDVAAALDGLAADPARCARLGAAAREKALGYDWERKIDTMLDIYDRVLAQHRS